MNANELRQKFIEFFEGKDHIVIPAASLVPKEQDITESDMTLFTTAGMQQFKRFYVNPSEAPYSRATSSQKCIRTGDIDEVGDDTHLSFFEMLGNFSFGYPDKKGSYFKKEAIEYAWDFLTEILKIDKNRIHTTYFDSEKSEKNQTVPTDIESKKLLENISDLKSIVPQGDDNFWSLGSEGSPGGPTVEFYIDDIEVWNLVFNEYVMQSGEYKPAEFKGVDTGMGLERLLTTLNGHDNVYETDLFEPILKKIEEMSGKKYGSVDQRAGVVAFHRGVGEIREFRILADHIKAAVFAIGDGAVPSNKLLGYPVRKMIRRAIVKAHQLGIDGISTTRLADVVFGIYKDTYFSSVIPAPYQVRGKAPAGIQDSPHGSPGTTSSYIAGPEDDIKKELEKEETKFNKTLSKGLQKLEEIENAARSESLKNLLGVKAETRPISGRELFDLYQTFGFPLELSLEIGKEKGIKINHEAIEQFNNLLGEHKDLSRTASAGMFKGGLADAGEIAVKYHTATHLLHQALRQVLGDHVQQKGSNITADRLRFDFVHTDKMTPEQISEVESIVNEQIEKDLPVTMEEMTVEEAKNSGAIGLFEHKYGDKVKVYTIGESTDKYFSKEICGGPHVTHTGELGKFKIKKEESSSAGIRRIKAVLE